MIKKTTFPISLFLLLAALTDGKLLGAAASPNPDNIRLTWSESPKTTQTIAWRTDSTVSTGRVEFSRTGQSTITVMAPPPEKLATKVGDIHLFAVTLRDLQPDTRYRYRVGDGTRWSRHYTFDTEPEDPKRFKFLVFGDSHEKKASYQVWQKTVTQAYQQNPEARFVMNVGDLIYAGKDYAQWQAWLAAGQGVIANIPEMPVIGDHEPRGVTSKEEWQRPEYFVKLFKVPPNGPPHFKGEVYSFDYGSAHIAVLNSSFHYEFADPAQRQAMIQAEMAWLDADLAATSQPWKIVVYHDATYNLQPDRAGTLTKTYLVPIIDKHHVDVVFNGHDHAMARSYYMKDGDFMPGPAQGTIYFLAGRSGDNAKDALGPKIWHSFFFDPQEQTCYLSVEVDRGEMIIKTRLENGTLIDTLVINKQRPDLSTPVTPFGAYQSPRFAAFGALLQFGEPPQQNAAGEWFVDLHALAAYLSGKYDPGTGSFSYNEDEIQLHFTPDMFLDPAKKRVSLTGLRSAGFHCRYHKAMNLVMVERWRD